MPQPSAVTTSASSLFSSTLATVMPSVFITLPRSGRIAWRARSRPCLADPPAESPSTMNSSEPSAPGIVQSLSLPGRVSAPRGGGPAHDLGLRRAARLARARRQDDPRHDGLGHRPVVVQPVLERGPHHRVEARVDLGVVQPVLGLALELRLLQEHAQDADEPLADVLGGDRHALGREVVRLDVVAHGLAEAGAQPVLVRAARPGRDAVHVAPHVLVGRLRPLQHQVEPHPGLVLAAVRNGASWTTALPRSFTTLAR